MVVHQAVGVTDPVVALVDVLEGIEKVDPVLVALEYGLSFIAAGSDMVNSTGILYAERAGHNG
jgi:hypothetical protein